MTTLELRPSADCRWDLVSLGEVMLRLDPGQGHEGVPPFPAVSTGGERPLVSLLREQPVT